MKIQIYLKNKKQTNESQQKTERGNENKNNKCILKSNLELTEKLNIKRIINRTLKNENRRNHTNQTKNKNKQKTKELNENETKTHINNK